MTEFARNLEQAKTDYSENFINQAKALQADSNKKDKEIGELHQKVRKLQKLLKESQLYKYVEGKVANPNSSTSEKQ